MAAADLDKKLTELQQNAEEQQRQYDSSTRLLYQNLAEGYIWWREADWDRSYLDALYAKNKITARGESSNQINRATFSKLVRLIFKTNNYQTQSHWAYALLAIHDRFANDDVWLQSLSRNPKQAASEIVNHIYDSNGIGNLTESYKHIGEDEGFELEAEPTQPNQKRAPNEQRRIENDKQLLTHKLDVLRSYVGDRADCIPNTPTNDANLAVLLVRQNGSQTEVIGSSAEQQIINAVLLESGGVDLANVAPSLRMLCETLLPHTPPKALKNPRSKFYEKYKRKIERRDGEIVSVSDITFPRLLVMKDGKLLVSKRLSDASLTTIATPSKPLASGTELFLRGNDRSFVEEELLRHQALPLFSAKQNVRLANTDKGVRAAKQLTLRHNVTKAERNLYFYEPTWISSGDEEVAASLQPIPNIPKNFKFNYRLDASAALLKQLTQMFEEWAYKKNNIYTKPVNSCVDFAVTKNGILLHTWWENGSYVARPIKLQLDKASKLTTAKVARSKGGVKGTRINPLDIAQPFIALSKMQLKGNKARIEASSDLLKITYATELASYEIFVPCCDEKGRRNAELFTPYEFSNA